MTLQLAPWEVGSEFKLRTGAVESWTKLSLSGSSSIEDYIVALQILDRGRCPTTLVVATFTLI